MGLGGMGASVGSLGGCLLESDEEAGFMIRVDRQLVCLSSSSSFSPSSSFSSLASGVYLKEYLGLVQDAWPRPNWILTEDTTVEGERSEEGKEEDLCMGVMPLPRPLAGVRGVSPDWGSTCCPDRLSWFCLALFRALRTGEDGAGGKREPESSTSVCSFWALSSAPTPSVGGSVSAAVSLWF